MGICVHLVSAQILLLTRNITFEWSELSSLPEQNSSGFERLAQRNRSVVLVNVELNPGPTRKAKPSKSATLPRRRVSRSVPRPSRRSPERSLGSRIGGFLGDAAQKLIMKVTGMGDYQVSQNSLFPGSVNGSPPPSFSPSRHSTRLVHREFLFDVKSSIDFRTTFRSRITASNSVLFPWLASIASQFEQYQFHGLIFEYKPTSGTAVASTNPALGVVAMATQYNTYSPPFSSKIQLDSYEYAVSCEPSQACIAPVECDPRQNPTAIFYTDINNVVSQGDSRLSQMGWFNLITNGMQAADNTVGELWVSYDVELIKPRLELGYFGNSVLPTFFSRFVFPDNVYSPSAPFLTGVQNTSTFVVGSDPVTRWSSVNNNFAVSFSPRAIYFPPSVACRVLLKLTMSVAAGGSPSNNIVVFTSAMRPGTAGLHPYLPLASPDVKFTPTMSEFVAVPTLTSNMNYATVCPAPGGIGANVNSVLACYSVSFVLTGSGSTDPVTGRSSVFLDFASSNDGSIVDTGMLPMQPNGSGLNIIITVECYADFRS